MLNIDLASNFRLNYGNQGNLVNANLEDHWLVLIT